MKKWEHKFIISERSGKGIFGFALPKEISWKVHYVDGKVQQNWQEITLYNFLDKMGKEGWEVVNMSTHMSIRSGSLPIEHIYIILKREVV